MRRSRRVLKVSEDASPSRTTSWGDSADRTAVFSTDWEVGARVVDRAATFSTDWDVGGGGVDGTGTFLTGFGSSDLEGWEVRFVYLRFFSACS